MSDFVFFVFCFRRFPDVFPTSSRCRSRLVGPMASNRSWADDDFTLTARYREIAVGPREIYRPRRVPDRIDIKSESSRQRGVYWAAGGCRAAGSHLKKEKNFILFNIVLKSIFINNFPLCY